jgi:hypothetical protein
MLQISLFDNLELTAHEQIGLINRHCAKKMHAPALGLNVRFRATVSTVLKALLNALM